MDFNLMYSWVAAGSMVAMLVGMGLRNRSTGYRSEKTDVVLEILMLWAKVTRQDALEKANTKVTAVSASSIAPAPATASSSTSTSDLAALGMALGYQSAKPAASEKPEYASQEQPIGYK